jgi:hypothetical protein
VNDGVGIFSGILNETGHELFPVFGELNIGQIDNSGSEGLRDFGGKEKIGEKDLGFDLFDELLVEGPFEMLKILKIGDGLLDMRSTRV